MGPTDAEGWAGAPCHSGLGPCLCSGTHALAICSNCSSLFRPFWSLSPPCPWGQLSSGLRIGLLSEGGAPGAAFPGPGSDRWGRGRQSCLSCRRVATRGRRDQVFLLSAGAARIPSSPRTPSFSGSAGHPPAAAREGSLPGWEAAGGGCSLCLSRSYSRSLSLLCREVLPAVYPPFLLLLEGRDQAE